ncbi:MAG: maltose alpha-D-glucosyltransferase [Dehalococcoidales bacterium]
MAISKNPPIGDGPLWYKDAIIYEVHVRAFSDSNADGIGDFHGLINKLDYLQDLGVNTIWLLPFYPSPLKDDGYDISDYHNILPMYGTMPDFKALVDAAHCRGLRVITELVLNHTSDQHPWFQRARRAPKGSLERDFYVWSDTPDKYRGTRIIFTDTEKSNWAWDPVAKQYYWHRFYSHQPDLNFDNPAVKKALLEVMDYWLKLGIDGLRVDAVPYLYEREGTSSENLPETHVFLKELRAHVDKKLKNRMLLAEANQWPEDAAAYFGQGDEFHMAFHFPIMPRLFMALKMEDRFPIIDILRQTPSIPDSCQWAIFLRNHDELTLEMVTEEERDYMYRVYAADPAARLNLGIRRRLAPLLGNDRKKIELMDSLLFSLPGTPVIYYGDEIGMGDNYRLHDRDGVRTPMQWDAGRNAGFSRAAADKLYLPLITGSEYDYKAVNVASQLVNPDSLLWSMKRIIALRKRHEAFGHGSTEFLNPANRKILAYFRQYGEEVILVVANLSHLAQQTQLDLSRFKGYIPVDLFGRVEFSPITGAPYCLTLSPYAFYWFSLEKRPLRRRALLSQKAAAVAQIQQNAEHLLAEKANRPVLETALLEYLKRQRWFRGKARQVLTAEILDVISVHFAGSMACITLLRVEYAEGEPETYIIPLITGSTGYQKELSKKYPQAVIARLESEILYDATVDNDFNNFLLSAVTRRCVIKGNRGDIVSVPLKSPAHFVYKDLTPALMEAEQTNTSVTYGDKFILKLFRKLEEGINPDVEIGRFLTGNTSFTNISRVAGSLEYRGANGQVMSLAVLQDFVPSHGDAWQYTLDSLEQYFRAALSHPPLKSSPGPRKHPLDLPGEPPALAKETIGSYLASARLLGRRTAELHIALAGDAKNPGFAPEPFNPFYQMSLYQSFRGYAMRTLELLRERLAYLPSDAQKDARAVLDKENAIIGRFDLVRRGNIAASRIRCHGDYHLGQVLFTSNDFVIIDFEGEPARSLSERRLKRSPLRDVAGMVRSFHYAAQTALNQQKTASPENHARLESAAQYWYLWVSISFLHTYLNFMKPTGLLPGDRGQLKVLLDAFLLDKALYEVGYELNNRPAWVKVPLQGILQLLAAKG